MFIYKSYHLLLGSLLFCISNHLHLPLLASLRQFVKQIQKRLFLIVKDVAALNLQLQNVILTVDWQVLATRVARLALSQVRVKGSHPPCPAADSVPSLRPPRRYVRLEGTVGRNEWFAVSCVRKRSLVWQVVPQLRRSVDVAQDHSLVDRSQRVTVSE